MAKIKMFRAQPTPVFHTLSIDLFGPMEIKDNVIKRVGRRNTIGKVWGILFCCTAIFKPQIEQNYAPKALKMA